VRAEIYKLWPELRSEYAPLAVELVTDRADEFVRRIESLPDYREFVDAKQKEESLIGASMKLEREKACCERLLQACEEAVLAANLPRIATPDVISRYKQIVAMEEGSLTPATAVATSP
jgi:hypothetical protein